MPAVLKHPLIAKFLCLTAVLLANSAAHASPYVSSLDDFHPNCDIRQLNLSQTQQAALRRIRSEYKQATDRAYRKASRSDRTRRQNIVNILSTPAFDQNAARDYVEARYLSSMDFAVDQLSIQHRFYQLLNPQQRQLWLSSCLR